MALREVNLNCLKTMCLPMLSLQLGGMQSEGDLFQSFGLSPWLVLFHLVSRLMLKVLEMDQHLSFGACWCSAVCIGSFPFPFVWVWAALIVYTSYSLVELSSGDTKKASNLCSWCCFIECVSLGCKRQQLQVPGLVYVHHIL